MFYCTFKRIIYICCHSGTDCRTKTCCAIYFITYYRNIKYICKNLHKQITVGTTTCNDQLIDRCAYLIAHISNMTLHCHRNCFQNRTVNMASCMTSIKSDHNSLLVTCIYICKPVQNSHQTVTSNRYLFSFPAESFLRGHSLFFCKLRISFSKNISVPAYCPHTAADSITVIKIFVRHAGKFRPCITGTF